ncbi:hypothetical protein BofuT4_uP153190.1 [Botrytis cinerea T4]|uniref:Uncharacterized protein n=1 Tax=Botryotinia fuckeliana (strain T4) TaxID=999810 RepID=G2YVV9_BOTF4|nr:hypothetical protein BofuT4_uP153190.1 [Botrytis cinerea T4]
MRANKKMIAVSERSYRMLGIIIHYFFSVPIEMLAYSVVSPAAVQKHFSPYVHMLQSPDLTAYSINLATIC